MATGPTLPPQAYTREILTAAFNWLQGQPESVKKLATTPDALVGLYTRAKRFGNSSLEADAPVSSQNFMSDLKNLAEGLKQFEEPREFHRPQVLSEQVFAPAPAYQASYQPTYQQPAPQPSLRPETFASPQPSAPNSALNDRSWAMIHEVKSQLNLSSDAETINMMLALAYKSLKNLLT